ncbi:MAG: CRISPR-associated endonuclease Cas3'' [Oscillospiraceae bacterium]|nr:CRISPR-associated endonuclease Cas3'' [Oscillospiraceae bacterium]
MREVYYAKSANQAGEKETVEKHLSRVGKLCGEFLEPAGYGAWGRAMGKAHDYGKISEAFQQVLEHRKTGVNHALPGVVLVYKLYGKAAPKTAELLAMVVANHHGTLKGGDYGREARRLLRGESGGDRLDRENYEISLFGMAEHREAIALWETMFQKEPALEPLPDFGGAEDRNLSKMLFTRFLYSALTDADWSSSAEHDEPGYLARHTGPGLDAAAALERVCQLRREKQAGSTSAPSLNALRDQLFDACLKAGAWEPGLFTLTAPPGLGKTLSLFAFAAKHCRIWGKRRIILILPFLAIIEQNCKDYRAVLPELLEVHSSVKWTQETSPLAERWDVPCVVTTSVSFFEPLFSAHARDCRHLHQLANSVIVLDEAQALPNPLLDATLRTVKELCDHYGCTVVFSTATQPSFQDALPTRA